MAALGILALFGGVYLMYVAYEAIHNKTSATPVKKASTAL